MNEYDDQWLRDGLAAAVPTPPEAADRAQRATVKARRARQVRVAGVLGVAAVVVGAAVAWTVSSGDDSDRAADGTKAVSVTCPEVPAEMPYPEKATGKAGEGVPDGATTARLCQGQGTKFDVPLDALVVGIEDLIATANGLDAYPEWGPNSACNLDFGTGYQIVFGYPDGSTTAVTGELYGCRAVTIGGDDVRSDPETLWARYSSLLREQRDALDPPASTPAADLSCGGPQVSPAGRAADMTEAVYCFEGEGVAIPIPAKDVAVLVADMQTSGPIGVTRACFTPGRIVGQTAWGDTVQTSALCGGDRWAMEDDLAWSVSPASKAILDRLATEAR
ncbi:MULTISPECIES: hypothetical protein [unclassified Nocardioides]|uniref:hypothetical protein n=1 Tax=unclassified Nocardioides TaxID=2615069 RepID=UPI0006FCE977|nr:MULTISPECIES: hypothetical protein [unclassified Nocardioides]KRA38324.1 hypothetical protein ASD81_06710 [Nocardioides sp. Root614]KRA92283.1 hypothetical protein ASD84_06975 [Nocardioides sp. Root682]